MLGVPPRRGRSQHARAPRRREDPNRCCRTGSLPRPTTHRHRGVDASEREWASHHRQRLLPTAVTTLVRNRGTAAGAQEKRPKDSTALRYPAVVTLMKAQRRARAVLLELDVEDGEMRSHLVAATG